MTVKELAEFCGKTERTIRNWIKNAQGKNFLTNGKKFLTNGHETDLTIDEVEKILQCSSLSNYTVSILMKNAREKQSEEVTTQSAEVATQNAKVSFLSEKDIAIISQIVSVTVSETIKALDGRMTNIEQKIEQRKILLPAPQLDARAHIKKLIDEYVSRNKIEHGDAYRYLYREFFYRTKCNASLCAKNRGMKTIDYIDNEGMIETLEAIAMEVL